MPSLTLFDVAHFATRPEGAQQISPGNAPRAARDRSRTLILCYLFTAPKGQPQISPGQRPGNGGNALTGRGIPINRKPFSLQRNRETISASK
jgi:hypothetical protein